MSNQNFKNLLLISCCLLSGFAISQPKPDKPYPQRIIALAPHAVETVFMLGAGERIIATTEYSDYPEAANKIERIGGYAGIQIERVLELEPDLIIAWKSGNKEQDIEQLQKLGLPLYLSHTKKISDIPNEIRILGQKLGLQEQGEYHAKQFEQGLQALKNQYQNKQKVKVFYQLWSEPLRAMAAGSWINKMVEGCGGENIFNDTNLDYPQVSIENVLLAKPEAIIIPSHHGSKTEAGEIWNKWPEIPAVINNNIHFINGDILHRFSGRVLQGMQAICDVLEVARQSNK